MKLETVDAFERLGLPRRFSVNPVELERHYLERSRETHPDFASGDEDASAALNEAYATLRDPFRRAEHLLALLGGPSAKDDKSLPPAFLMEMLELREEIEAAKASPADAARIEADLVNRTEALAGSLEKLFDKSDTAAIRKELNCVRYLSGLLRDLLS
jgi:molecular chaperone HscB